MSIFSALLACNLRTSHAAVSSCSVMLHNTANTAQFIARKPVLSCCNHDHWSSWWLDHLLPEIRFLLLSAHFLPASLTIFRTLHPAPPHLNDYQCGCKGPVSKLRPLRSPLPKFLSRCCPSVVVWCSLALVLPHSVDITGDLARLGRYYLLP